MRTDVIIATYNRPESLMSVIKKLLESTDAIQNIIVIDSSVEENKEIQTLHKVRYIRSSHANQPYQRYVGYLASNAEILVFLDDDMELVDPSWLTKIENIFSNNDVAGVAIAFTNDNEFIKTKIPKTKFGNPKKPGVLRRTLKAITGNPYLAPGDFWLCGIRGVQPFYGKETKWLQGGAFAAKRSFMYKNFNFKLFDLFEEKFGMGEDVILGYTLSKQGKLIYIPQVLFYHNDQKDSTYTIDLQSYGKRVAYSRLYLSYEYARLSGMSKNSVLIHFIWYMLWRLGGMSVNYILDPSKERKEMIRGYFSGIKKAIRDRKMLSYYNDGEIWKKEAIHDIKRR